MRSCSRFFALIAALLLLFVPAGRAATAPNLRCEYFRSPRGVDTRQPRLSWQAASTDKSAVQAAYRITVAKTAEALAGGSLVWDSGWVETDLPAQVCYDGEPLESDTDYFWQVELRAAEGKVSPPEETGFWSTGLLDKSDWSAQWIENSSLPENEVSASAGRKAPTASFFTSPGQYQGEIFVPAADRDQVDVPEGARHLRDENGYAVFAVPGGRWLFESPLP
ncbi:MAG: hypothetical protein J6S75_03330 [Thermoguttaceae bacterium]|nr:hypothetical protein [Thermoguttaceae bacterium]